MDLNPNPILRLRTVCLHAAFVVGAFALCGCAQAGSGSVVTQEEPMDRSPPKGDAGVEADRVAALVDSIAAKVAAEHPLKPAEPFQGPEFTPHDLEERVLALAGALRVPNQIQAEFVAQKFHVPLIDPQTGRSVGVRGVVVGGGSYSISVSSPYVDVSVRSVGVRALSEPGGACVLDYRRIVNGLKSMGYEGNAGPRFFEPQVEFYKSTGDFRVFLTLSVDSHDFPRCIKFVDYAVEGFGDV
ncbi:hypothetical protein [Stenotrophomonas sp.]|uniref:hypothetical protein n=1 Tax=Stenotrophomonas sp. TaxID=69392 RepID=UPI0028AF5075|nr:hypothetical protein [Stenotrophomonas sp.]